VIELVGVKFSGTFRSIVTVFENERFGSSSALVNSRMNIKEVIKNNEILRNIFVNVAELKYQFFLCFE